MIKYQGNNQVLMTYKQMTYYNKAHMDLQWNETLYENYILQRIDTSFSNYTCKKNLKLDAIFLMSSTPSAG